VSCEEWLAEAREARRRRGRLSPDAKPPEPGPEGADYWKKYFGLGD
jgi:hypothetical protein